jgi:hypothetical protein
VDSRADRELVGDPSAEETEPVAPRRAS